MGRTTEDDAHIDCADARRGGRRVDLGKLYLAVAPKLVRRLGFRLSSDEDAKDIVQDAFARMAGSRSLGEMREPEAFLNRVIRNLLINRSQLLANKAQHVPIDEELGLAMPPDQAYGIEVEQMRDQYRAIVATLPPRTREVFLMHRVEDLSYKEIAARLEISVRTVEWHIAEAIMRIDKALERG
jgi:RNA polymerase sigma-70 factor (ECF subfamily)